MRKFSLSLGPRWVPYTLTCVTRGYANQFLRIEKLSPIVRSFRELFFPRAIIASRVEPLLPLHGHIRGVYTLSQYKYSPECYSRKFISILRDFGINIVHKLRSVFDIRHRFFLFFFFESIENQVGLILAEQGEEEERGGKEGVEEEASIPRTVFKQGERAEATSAGTRALFFFGRHFARKC